MNNALEKRQRLETVEEVLLDILLGTAMSFSFSMSRNASKPLNFLSGNIDGSIGPRGSGGFGLSVGRSFG